jgi:hypothetical protein
MTKQIEGIHHVTAIARTIEVREVWEVAAKTGGAQ